MRGLNRGAGMRQRVPLPQFPDADGAVRAGLDARPAEAVDILFVNPPAPDGGIWIRSQHRVGRRSREGMIWPQVSLAQMAALFPDLRVEVVDAIPGRMDWAAFERLLEEKRPRYYVTQVTAPTLRNDMYGTFLARSVGATTVAFGTHVTAIPRETLRAFPTLDYVLYGEPELTLRELVDTLERAQPQSSILNLQSPISDPQSASPCTHGRCTHGRNPQSQGWWPGVAPEFEERLHKLFTDADSDWQPAWLNVEPGACNLSRIKGLVWRNGSDVVANAARPFIHDLDDLPLPRHDLLPLEKYRAPLVRSPYAFVVTSRGCPGGCRFCIKHVSYGHSVRFRSPENILAELELLAGLGVRSVNMYADLFTVSREQVVGLCELILERGLRLQWTCNSRVDFVDPEMLRLMGRAGCRWISWGIESGSAEILRRVRKGITLEQVEQALRWSHEAGIRNWGYFIVGLPGETEQTIQETIRFARRLPLDLVLFHIAAPYPGSPLFFEVVEQGWFRPGTRWEQVDMDRSTVLDYPDLQAEELERWARRAFRAWALRPGPVLTYLRMLLGSTSLWRPALEIGLESLGWAAGR
ncbi:MAG TPA: B12-binding domain-containing radical SAM protein [Anaerolineae bacterium]|nr:B12-binding domain-containing radical SAM protein [Anaerolineae bacterium]